MNNKSETLAGFAFGFDAGVRYFFTPSIGVFAELGYLGNAMKKTFEYSTSNADGDTYSGKVDVDIFVGGFAARIGVTFKF